MVRYEIKNRSKLSEIGFFKAIRRHLDNMMYEMDLTPYDEDEICEILEELSARIELVEETEDDESQ